MRHAVLWTSLLSAACGCDDATTGPHSGANVIRAVPAPITVEGFDPEVVQLIATATARIDAAPRDASAWLELGMAYEAHSMLELAEPCYEESVEIDGSNAKAWYRLAHARAQNGRLVEALSALERVTVLAPDYLPARLRSATWRMELGELEAAEESLEQARELAPRDDEVAMGSAQLALARGEPEAALAHLAGEDLLTGPNAPFVHKLRGSALARSGRDAEAEVELALGRDARPRVTDPWSLEVARMQRGAANLIAQASILIEQGRAADAVRILEELRERGEPNVRLLERLATAYALSGRLPEAVEVLEEAVRAQPGQALARVRLAEAYSVMGDPERALATCEEALRLDARSPEAHATRVWLLRRLERLPEMLAAWDAALEIGIADAALAVEAGKVAVELERMEEARAIFARATTLDPSIADGWIGIAVSEHHFGRDEEARAALARARALDPGHAMVPILEAELDG